MDERNLTTSPTRQQELSASTQEGNQIKARAVTGLLSTFRTTLGKVDINGVLASYALALEAMDPVIVETACERWIKGLAGDEYNYAFPPSPPQLAIVCRQIRDVFAPPQVRSSYHPFPFHQVERGYEPDEDEKRGVEDGFAALLTGMRGRNPKGEADE